LRAENQEKFQHTVSSLSQSFYDLELIVHSGSGLEERFVVLGNRSGCHFLDAIQKSQLNGYMVERLELELPQPGRIRAQTEEE
jgi:hypothetical protein